MAGGPDFADLAKRATFVGSPEHKRVPNPLANPALRSDASDCDDVDPTLSSADPMFLLHVLRSALSRGQVSGPMEGDFPRYVHGWMLLAGTQRALFRGRLTNRVQGVYKGYFEELRDLPVGVRQRLGEGGGLVGGDRVSLAIDFSWLDGAGVRGPDAFAWADLAIRVADREIVAVDMRNRTVRSRFVTSLLPLVEWMVNTWPRLTEERALASAIDQHSWQVSHSLRAGRGGGPMPDVRLRRLDSNRISIEVLEDGVRPPGISLSFATNFAAVTEVSPVLRELARLISAVAERMREADPWTFEELTRRWTAARDVRALLAGRLGLALDEFESLDDGERAALDRLIIDDSLVVLAEGQSDRHLSARLEHAERIAALLPSADELAREKDSWRQARISDCHDAPWTLGWRAAEEFRQSTSLNALAPAGARLQRVLEEAFSWPVDRQLRVVPDGLASIDMVMLRETDRMPITLTRVRSEPAQRFRLAKSIYYALCTSDRIVVDSARMPRHSEANAFAAELLAPRAYIAQHVPDGGWWSDDAIETVARQCAVDPRVIMHQIDNRDLGLREAQV